MGLLCKDKLWTYNVKDWFHPLPLQVLLSLDSRRSACRRSFQSLWLISSSHTAVVSFLLWGLWWSGSKPSRLSYPRLSTRSKVHTLIAQVQRDLNSFVKNWRLAHFFVSVFVSVLHEVEEDTVEFSWKRNRLFNHTACLVLYQICMEVCSCLFVCAPLNCDNDPAACK